MSKEDAIDLIIHAVSMYMEEVDDSDYYEELSEALSVVTNSIIEDK